MGPGPARRIPPKDTVQSLAVAYWTFHYAKRIYETFFVHRRAARRARLRKLRARAECARASLTRWPRCMRRRLSAGHALECVRRAASASGRGAHARRFSHGTMPINNLFKNCGYYWGFAALVSYYVNHPLYTPPPHAASYLLFAFALFCQASNL